MRKNIGKTDRIVRLVIAVLFIGQYLVGFATGLLGVVGVFVGAILGLTALVSFCPIYAIFRKKPTN